MLVICGMDTLQTVSPQEQEKTSLTMKIHPDWKGATNPENDYRGDVCVVTVSSPFVYTEYVKNITLPYPNCPELSPGTTCYAAG